MVDESSGLEELLEYPAQRSTFSWQTVIRRYPLQVGLGGLGVLLVILSLMFLWREYQQDSQVTVIPAEENGTTVSSGILVHIAGAVQQPGLYQLESNARINDALVAAGGLAEEADRDWFSKNVNLAQKVSDGAKLYVPFVGDGGVAGFKVSSDLVVGAQTGTVNINTAPAAELETLPKIGPATAQKIISYRQEHGSFQSVEELVQVPGIGEKTLELLRNQISIF